MIEKRLLHQLLLKIRRGAVKVSYWDGTTVTYGQGAPYFTLKITTPKAVRAILKNLSLGFGESYMDGTLEIEGGIDQPIRLVAENQDAFGLVERLSVVRPKNLNIRTKQASQIQHHYDLGNAFYKLWLDRSMMYSCAYFRTPKDTLEQAQANKVAHLLRKLQLSKGQSLLDIGSGWGTLLIQAAKEYGVSGLGVTLSHEQHKHSLEAARAGGVEKLVSFELANYQDLPERGLSYDRIISVGMFEHVGRRNQADYYKAVDALLKPQGLSVLHTITQETETNTDPWTDKYIFPGGYAPSVRQIVHELPQRNFKLIDYENLRMHYAMTLDEWLRRFETHKDKVISMYDERFYRMWRLYLGSSSASFRYENLSLSQFVFSKGLNNNLPLTREFIYPKS